MRNSVGCLLLLSVLAALPTSAQTFYYPSTRYLNLSAPLFPKSYDDCRSLAQDFNAEIQKLNQQHEECLQGAPRDESGSGGTCSKVSCQGLHTAREKASKMAAQEGQVCGERVSRYLQEQQQAQAQRQRRTEADAERERRQRMVTQARDQRDAARGIAEKASGDAKAARDAQKEKSAAETSIAPPPPVQQLAMPTPLLVERAPEPPPPSVGRRIIKALTGEQKEALKDAGIGMLVTYLTEMSVKSIKSALIKGVGKTLDNPVLEIAKPFLEIENYKNIRETVEAQIRQSKSGSWNENESQLLDQVDRESYRAPPGGK